MLRNLTQRTFLLLSVPGEIDDVTVTAATHDAITVRWSPPNKPNGQILEYMIIYNSTGGKLSGSKTTEGNKLTASIQNLIPNTTYSIFVTARTSKGFGGQGTSVLARTRKYPKN